MAIANPPLNLLTQEVRRELGDIWPMLDADDTVRVVVLGDPASGFCAGADMKEFPQRFDPAVARAHGENAHRMILGLVAMRKPVLAAVRGHCMGGGLEVALGCGLRIAAADARFALPEVKRGVWPGTGGVFLLQHLVGSARARDLLLSGRTIDAAEALALGLVNRVVPVENFEQAVLDYAAELDSGPLSSIQAISTLLDHDWVAQFRRHMQYELELFVQTYQLPAAREGNLAFFEKRAPRW